MIYFSDAVVESVSRSLAANLGVEDTPDEWRLRLGRMIDSYRVEYAIHHPEKPPLSETAAWDRMTPMLRALGAEV